MVAYDSAADLAALYARVSNWGRWGDDDDRGTLNLLSPAAAHVAGLVRDGDPISLAHDLATVPSPDCPFPAQHHMLASGDALESSGVPGYQATRDYVGTDVHGLGLTHLDAPCHMFVDGRMYNGRPANDVVSIGAVTNTVMAAAGGIVGRGVLLDVPRARGVDHLRPGDSVTSADLDHAEAAAGLQVGPGDVLVVATGREARAAARGQVVNPFTEGLAGLHAGCLDWLYERGVAVLGGDGISDAMPPGPIESWPFPIHQIGIVSMGLWLIDNMRLAGLLRRCAEVGRWQFLFVAAPLRIPGGTGSPLNPLAIF